MFGKSIFKLMKYALIGGIVLVMGTLMLTSVVDLVYMTMSGDFVPLASLVIFTLIAIRLSVTFEGSWVVIKILLDVAAAISSVFLVMVIFLGALIPLGIVAALMLSGSTGTILTLVRHPSGIQDRLSQMSDLSSMQTLSTGGIDRRKSLMRAIEKSGMRVLILPEGSFEQVLVMLKERPQLPVALVHLADEDLLIVRTGGDITSLRRTKKILNDFSITDSKPASPLHSKVVLSLPILEAEGPQKLGMDQFMFISEEDTVKGVLEKRPEAISVYPSSGGLRLVVRTKDVFGLEAEEIPRHLLAKVVIGRDISGLTKTNIQGGKTEDAD